MSDFNVYVNSRGHFSLAKRPWAPGQNFLADSDASQKCRRNGGASGRWTSISGPSPQAVPWPWVPRFYDPTSRIEISLAAEVSCGK